MRFKALVLFCKPGTVRLLELGSALLQGLDAVGCLQLRKLLCRDDDGVNLPVFLNINGFSFGMGAHGAKLIFSLSGSDLHETP